MQSRLRFLVLATLAALPLLTSTAAALEKTSARFSDLREDDWKRTSTSCQIVYYNLCTGWIWVWSQWEGTDRFGVWFSSCCPGNFETHQLLDSFIYFRTGSPSGYGFTGALDVWTADAQGCPTGAPLHTEPFLPTDGWNQISWYANPIDVSGSDFVVTVTTGNYTGGNPMTVATDHPSAGPTGPTACGTCFPTTRVNRSFYYGTASSPNCPGVALPDICAPAFLWDVDLACTTPVETRSWGRIKELYK